MGENDSDIGVNDFGTGENDSGMGEYDSDTGENKTFPVILIIYNHQIMVISPFLYKKC